VPQEDNRPPAHPDTVGDLADEMLESGLFGEVAVRRHLWDEVYTAETYIAVLDTYSGHRSMPVELRHDLYERIRRRIDRHGGTVTKTYLATVNVARRL
jgi:hypothetical protein